MASTQSAEQDYLYALDDSDVCLFLIDNADGVSDAVLKEINRAKGQEKKSLYLFCKERLQEPTQIQQELKGAQGVHYYEASSFDEFISIGYNSLINDIIDIYRHYCKGRLADKEFENNLVTIREIDSIASESLNKKLLKGIDQTKSYMSSIILEQNNEIVETNEFDLFCKDFLKVLLGEKQIRDFNTSLLLEELRKKHSKSLYEVVELRWKAIQAYYGHDLSASMQFMRESLDKAHKNLLPTWLINDILIDLRNLQITKNITENQYFLRSEAQIALDESDEFLFYPVLDRLEKEYDEKLLEQNFDNKTESPYTTHLGNNIQIYSDYITNMFVIALFNGSLTHIHRTIVRLEKMMFSLCEQYDDWKFRVLLLKFAMINDKSKDIEKIISTFNEIFGKMNASDSISIYKMATSLPIAHKKLIAKLEIFRYLGYYFSDRDFQDIGKELIEEVNKWIWDDNKSIDLGGYIFKALKSNFRRLDNTEIAKICCEVFQRNCRRWYDDVFKLTATMGIEKVKNETVNVLISEIIKIIQDEKERSNCHGLEDAIIAARKSNDNLTKELEECVSVNMPHFYRTIYSLEVLTGTKEESQVHIQRYAEEIRDRNEKQGTNGEYSLYGDNPYLTITNIIRNNHLQLEHELIEKISSVALETLLKPKQSINAKIDAIQMLIFLNKYQFKDNFDFKKLYKVLMKNASLVETGFIDGFFEKTSRLTLQFNFLLLRICFGAVSESEILEIISIYNNQEDYEKIESLHAINNLMDNNYSKTIDKRNLYIFVQYVLGLSRSKSHDVRYNAVKALLQMCTPKTSKVVMTQLSKMMEVDSAPIKFLILNNIVNLKQNNEKVAALMLQKAKVDNHFLVRHKALEMLTI